MALEERLAGLTNPFGIPQVAMTKGEGEGFAFKVQSAMQRNAENPPLPDAPIMLHEEVQYD